MRTKNKTRRVAYDFPILTKSDGANNYRLPFVIEAADAERKSWLFLVQFETTLLKGQSLFSKYLFALEDSFIIGNPKISAIGCR